MNTTKMKFCSLLQTKMSTLVLSLEENSEFFFFLTELFFQFIVLVTSAFCLAVAYAKVLR